MSKNAVILLLLLLAVWLGLALARVENQRYALAVGMCRNTDFACLDKVETRTSKGWHIYYALTETSVL